MSPLRVWHPRRVSELWSRHLPLILLALLGLGLLVWRPRRAARSRALALFRCLLPSWRFFDQVEPGPVLLYRVAARGDEWGEWRDALTAPERTLGSLWLNAAGNLHLAQRSLVEHLVADLEDAAELGRAPDELVSYRLVCALVEQRVRAALGPSEVSPNEVSPNEVEQSAGLIRRGARAWTATSPPTPRYQFCLVDAQQRAARVPLEAGAAFLSGVHGSA